MMSANDNPFNLHNLVIFQVELTQVTLKLKESNEFYNYYFIGCWIVLNPILHDPNVGGKLEPQLLVYLTIEQDYGCPLPNLKVTGRQCKE